MTRPRGFLLDYQPVRKTVALLEQVDAVLVEYRDYLPLTLRQVFYRLVGAHGFEKTEQAYGRLCEAMSNARRGRRVSFDAIRDDGLTTLAPDAFSGMPDFWQAVLETANSYRLRRLDGQARELEVWVEAGGMASQIEKAVGEFGVTVYSSGGFDSLTVKHAAARRIAVRERKTVVLHVGDYDPSGLALFEAAQEDVSAFVAGMAGVVPEFVRVAVTPAQIAVYGLPGSPPKRTDRRGVWQDGDETVQAEALPPDVLAEEVRYAVSVRLDLEQVARVVAEEARQRERLHVELERYPA